MRPHYGMAVLCFVLFLTFLDNAIISATLSAVQSDLHAGVSQLQWVVSGYALAFASLMLMCGTLGDLYGRKKIMLIGVVVFCAGSVIGAVATNTATLIAGRVVMGIGAAASEPGTLSMIRHLYPERETRARALGIWAAVSGLALALGPVIGGVLVGLWSWHAVFWFNLIFGVVAFVAAAIVLPENSDPVRARLDFPGFVLGALALGSATFATIGGETAGYKAHWILALYGFAVLTAIAFVLVERRAQNPVLDVRLFRRPAFAGANVVAFTTYFGIFSIFFFTALYLEVVGAQSPYGLALDFLPLTVGMVIASLLTGRWVAAWGAKIPMAVGCVIAGVGILLTDLKISPQAGLSDIGWTLAIAGIGFGIAIVPVTSSALSSVPGEHSGMAASATNTSRELGAVAGGGHPRLNRQRTADRQPDQAPERGWDSSLLPVSDHCRGHDGVRGLTSQGRRPWECVDPSDHQQSGLRSLRSLLPWPRPIPSGRRVPHAAVGHPGPVHWHIPSFGQP